ncbi:hypothetical protein ATANTOWER_029783, partial [Ataeniobius toweri]|nr:hypothetical protein [Ataeniobius toweri]
MLLNLLKTYQLINPAASPDKQNQPQSDEEQMQTSQNLLGAETRVPSEHPGQRKTVQAEEVLLVQGLKRNLSSSDPGRKESKVVAKSKRPVHAPAESLLVRCGEEKVTVAVKKDFPGNGQLIHPDDLSLGGCMAVDAVDHILLFESELQYSG